MNKLVFKEIISFILKDNYFFTEECLGVILNEIPDYFLNKESYFKQFYSYSSSNSQSFLRSFYVNFDTDLENNVFYFEINDEGCTQESGFVFKENNEEYFIFSSNVNLTYYFGEKKELKEILLDENIYLSKITFSNNVVYNIELSWFFDKNGNWRNLFEDVKEIFLKEINLHLHIL